MQQILTYDNPMVSLNNGIKFMFDLNTGDDYLSLVVWQQ